MSTELMAYKFSPTALSEKQDILNGLTAEQWLKTKYVKGCIFGLDNLHKYGHYRLMGWSYDFTPFLTLFLVKQYDSWQEYYAPNKTALRNSIYGTIQRIVEAD
jgi:hypothetical protein